MRRPLLRLPRRDREVIPDYDPGRERRAERRARELMRSVIAPEEYEMYEQLGFVRVLAPAADSGAGGYGYLIYPHRPIVAYDTATGELLSEYCVAFPDPGEPRGGERLPDADDVLAKWMALRGDELALLAEANIDRPGTQVDPGQARRDILRLQEWATPADVSSDGSDGPGFATAQ